MYSDTDPWERPNVKVAKLIVLQGMYRRKSMKSKKIFDKPCGMSGSVFGKPSTLDVEVTVPEDVKVLKGFVNMSREELKAFADSMGLAMSLEDLEFCQKYFRDDEKRTQPSPK